jgi:hypothetical protein
MNNEERTYRFGEIMSALGLLPELTMRDENSDEEAESAQDWVLPNLTKGLSDTRLREALLCQIQREDEEAKFKLVALLTNSATKSVHECAENDTKPSDDDLEAIAISANILWGSGQVKGLYQMLGLLSHICSQFDINIPDLATTFIRSNEGIENFGRLDPIAILSGNVTSDDVREALQDGEE